MPLFVTEKDVFDIVVRYIEKGDVVLYLEDGETQDGTHEERFTFRKPSWSDHRIMMADTMFLDPVSGAPVLDPYRFMDRKIKTLLMKWTLSMTLVPENIDKLDPSLINYLNTKLDEHLTFKKSDNS